MKVSVLGKTYVIDPETGNSKLKFRSVDEAGIVETIPSVLIARIEDSLFFGNCFSLKERIKRLEMYGTLSVHPGEDPIRGRIGPSSAESTGSESGEALHCIMLDMSFVNDIDAR